MLVPVLLFALGLILSIRGGDWFVDGATGLARRFHLPELLVGATVVSIGTTLPEVLVSATSALGGQGDIAYGNAIGSIICNTSLIAALVIACRPPKIERQSLRIPVFFFFLAAAFYVPVACIAQHFSRATGFILLAIFAAYMFCTVRQVMRAPQPNDAAEVAETDQPLWKDLLLLVVGAALTALGANLLVDNGTLIAQGLGVPESVIALTLVALGTSLPELVTAITALVKGHSALSLGNIIGANLFNLVLASGVSCALSPFDIPQGKTLFGINATLVVDMPLMLFVMLFMTVPALVRGKLSRWQGVVLLAIYAAFCLFQFAL